MPRLTGTRVGLPDYAWDAQLHNFVDLTRQRMVKRELVTGLLVDVTDRSANTMADLARAAVQGDIAPRQFYEAMVREVRQAYNASAALGKGGWQQMSQADWGRNGGLLHAEYGRLRSFAQDIADGKLTEKQAEARARLYADSAYKRYWQEWQKQQEDLGNDEEAWITRGDEAVCGACIALEDLGWVPLGELPMPGDIHVGCRCEKAYRDSRAQPAKAASPGGAYWLTVREFLQESTLCIEASSGHNVS
jgi:hypothetical protein